MKSILFEVNVAQVTCKENVAGPFPFIWEVNVPLLPAYSVEYYSIKVDDVSDISPGDEDIVGDNIIVYSEFKLYEELKSVLIELHYHGIKDYSALFPKVYDPKLRDRLGQFYEEAEKNFEQGSWLSF